MAENLVESLRIAGIRVPIEVCSVGDLESSALVSICAQSLSLIADASPETEVSMDSGEVEVCSEMALAIKRIGYLSDLTFNQLLHPSEEESSKLIRFLLERISASSETRRNESFKSHGDGKGDDFTSYLEDWMEKDDENEGDANDFRRIAEAKLSDLRITSEVTKSDYSLVQGKIDVSGEVDKNWQGLSEEASLNERVSTSLQDRAFEMRGKTKKSELRDLEKELDVLKAAVELLDDQNTVEFHLEQLKEKVEVKRHSLQELKSQWEATIKPLEEKKKTLRRSLNANKPETWEKFERLEELELETQKVLHEVEKRKDELFKVSEELERQPKGASRKYHVNRVNEITKNSRKQDTDIERILKDTRELQLESNAIQERLHRTYAIVDEMVFREAKKDPVGRQAYRLLTSIHESFEQITEKILATDRVRREVAEREKKLAAMSSRSLNMDKLQANLDTIMAENERLEKHLAEKANSL